MAFKVKSRKSNKNLFGTKKRIDVYDDGGKDHIDRYTVVIGNDVYGMSANPNSTYGVNQYDDRYSDEEISRFVHNLKLKKVNLSEVPKDVKIAIKGRL